MMPAEKSGDQLLSVVGLARPVTNPVATIVARIAGVWRIV
jgi:hypothetical protein